MRQLIFLFFFLCSLPAFAQVDSVTVIDPEDAPNLDPLTDSNFTLISRDDGVTETIQPITLREYIALNVNPTPIGFTPAATGNISFLGQFVEDPLGDYYVIDMDGDAFCFTCSGGGRTDEDIQDLVGAMFSGNTETLIEITYEDSDGTFDAQVEDSLSYYVNDAGFGTSQQIIDTAAAIRSDMVRVLGDLLDVSVAGATNGSVIKYNGSSWAIGVDDTGAGGIPVRFSYALLRSSPPTDSLVFISHPDYAGLFRRVTTGTENSGTVIEDSANDFWQRIHDPGYYNVNWFLIGGAIDNNQIGGIINSYSDVLNAIMDESAGGCTVDFSGPNSPTVFELDKRIDLAPYVTFIGQGDTLRRHATPWTTITAAGVAADGQITVADTTGFRLGQRVTVTTYRSHGGVLVSKKEINGIPDANTLDLEGTIGGDVAIGDTVFVSFSMFINGDALELGNVNFQGLVFDGNAAANPYTVSWSQQTTLNISNNSGSHLSVSNCGFHDTPSENMIAATATIRDCEAENLGGSFYHISGIPDTAYQVHIENVWVNNANTATTDSTSHSEALIVSSASPANVKIYNCQFFNGEEPVIGDFGGSTDYWEIQNSRVENFDGISFGSVGASQAIEGLRIQNNQFINCNSLDFTGGDLLNGEVLIDPVISNNTFINTAVRIEGSRNLRFTDNTMLYEPAEGGFTNYIEDGLPYQKALCYFSEFAQLDFENNVLRSDTVALPDTLVYGVIFDNTGVFDNGISTQFYLGYGLNCSGNTIDFFQRGITCDTAVAVDPATGDNRRTRIYHDWHIRNNTVRMLPKGLANSWGILVGPGVNVTANNIATTGDTLLTSIYPVFAYGVDDQGSSQLNLRGARILYNEIWGPWNFAQTIHSIFIGGDPATDEGGFNCQVMYNLVPTPISGGGAIQSPAISTVLNNDLIADEFPLITAPVFPPALNFEY